jgi:dUTPase
MEKEKEKMKKAMTTSPVSKFFIKKLVPHAVLPKKGTPGAAGYDLCAL